MDSSRYNKLPMLDLSANDIALTAEASAYNNASQAEHRKQAAIERNIAKKLLKIKQQSNDITLEDYSAIKDDNFRDSFISLCADWENRKSIRYCNTNNGDYSEVKCYCWFAWVEATRNQYNIIEQTKLIGYEDHFAVPNRNTILIADEFLMHNPDGSIRRLRKDLFYAYGGKYKKYIKRHEMDCGINGVSAHDWVENICNLFVWMLGKTNFEIVLWHVMNFIQKSVEIKDFLDENETDREFKNTLSPRKVYDILLLTFSRNSTKKPHCKHHHQKVYYEPGFEAEGRAAYKKYKSSLKYKMIMQVIGICLSNGDAITVANILKYSKAVRGLNIKSERSLKAILKEMKEDSQYGVYLKEERFRIKTERKKQDTSIRKKQSRSEWHRLVEEGLSYSEILEQYPDVSKSAYKSAKQRLSRKNLD